MPRDTRHQTQWAAQFAVASELCKRGYEVALTLGYNTPLADLMVISPDMKKQFIVDVKGLATKGGYWQIKKKIDRDDLFYILALVPKNEANRFFILRQSQVNRFIDDEFQRCKPEQQKQGIEKLRLGIRWRDADPEFSEAWTALPA